jgi:hypothetical protein
MIVEHCNLNCAGCSTFSPVAEEEYVGLANLENDLRRLRTLTNSRIKQIGISGGEPLLHTNINSILTLTRKYFLNAHISLGTNGILLLQQNINFWETCKNQKIDICVNHYPIKIDHDTIQNKCRQYNIDLFEPGVNKEYGMFQFAINQEGNCNGEYDFYNCVLADGCLLLRNGKLYPYPIVGNVYKFNRFFNAEIPVTDSDSVDIYKC